VDGRYLAAEFYRSGQLTVLRSFQQLFDKCVQ
jgi:hypothetical protein